MVPNTFAPQRTAWILLSALSMHASALAASYPVGSLAFRVDTLSFGTAALTFPAAFVRTETATTVEVTLPADVLFDFDKADIRPAAQPALHELATLLKDKARGPVSIQGHTDALGEEPYNQKLSERRAASVKLWLATREGLATMPMTTSGLGARSPVAANRLPNGADNPEGRQLNRRVTIVFRK